VSLGKWFKKIPVFLFASLSQGGNDARHSLIKSLRNIFSDTGPGTGRRKERPPERGLVRGGGFRFEDSSGRTTVGKTAINPFGGTRGSHR